MNPSMIPRLNKVLKQRIAALSESERKQGEKFLSEILNLAAVADHNDLNMGDIFEQQTIRNLTLSEYPNDIYHVKAKAIRYMSGILPMERKAGVTSKLGQFFKVALEKSKEENLEGMDYENYLDKIMSIYSHPGNRPEMTLISLQLETDINNQIDDEPESVINRNKIIKPWWSYGPI